MLSLTRNFASAIPSWAKSCAAWVRRALETTTAANLVFMDPDNGFAGASASATLNTGQKHVFVAELGEYLARGQSVIVYHRQTRERGGLLLQVERRLAELETLGAAMPWAGIFRRRSVRVYFVIHAPEHAAMLVSNLRDRADPDGFAPECRLVFAHARALPRKVRAVYPS